ncbi:hypothetical protein ACFLQI_03125 [Candidatus Undinarchaeota archaeon]
MNNIRTVVFDFGSGHKLDKLMKMAEDKSKLIVSFDMTRDTKFCPRSNLVFEYKKKHNLDIYKLKDNLLFVHHDVTKISEIPWKADYVVTRPLKANNGRFPSNMVKHLKDDCAVFIRPGFERTNYPIEYHDYTDSIMDQLSNHNFKFVPKGDYLLAVRGNIS